MNKNIYNSLLGFAVGDMLGVPVEFQSKEYLIKNPVKIFTGHEVYNGKAYHSNIPFGAWSDDTSLMIATIDSILMENKINNKKIFNNFWKWYHKGYFSYNKKLPFDIGISTAKAIMFRNSNLSYNYSDIKNNGNGGLMRLLPIIMFTHNKKNKETIIKESVSLTHAHKYSIIASIIYSYIFWNSMNSFSPKESVKQGIIEGYTYANKEYGLSIEELNSIFKNIINIDKINIEELETTGYVVDTLKTVLWGFYHSNDYNTSLLKIINLGGDTDTIGALLGALLGYNYGKIHWFFKFSLRRKKYLKEYFKKFSNMIKHQ